MSTPELQTLMETAAATGVMVRVAPSGAITIMPIPEAKPLPKSGAQRAREFRQRHSVTKPVTVPGSTVTNVTEVTQSENSNPPPLPLPPQTPPTPAPPPAGETPAHEEVLKLESEEVPAKKTKRFVVPTIEEWNAYALTLGWNAKGATVAYDHYVSNGWKVGRNQMKDWKASCRTCRSRDESPSAPIQPPTEKRSWE